MIILNPHADSKLGFYSLIEGVFDFFLLLEDAINSKKEFTIKTKNNPNSMHYYGKAKAIKR